MKAKTPKPKATPIQLAIARYDRQITSLQRQRVELIQRHEAELTQLSARINAVGEVRAALNRGTK